MPDIPNEPADEEIAEAFRKMYAPLSPSPFCLAVEPQWGYTTDQMVAQLAQLAHRIGIDVYAVIPVSAEGVVNTAETYHNDPVFNHSAAQFRFEPHQWPNIEKELASLKELRQTLTANLHFGSSNDNVKN